MENYFNSWLNFGVEQLAFLYENVSGVCVYIVSRSAWKRAANGLEYSYNTRSATEICPAAHITANMWPMNKTAPDRSLDVLHV